MVTTKAEWPTKIKVRRTIRLKKKKFKDLEKVC